jgi:Trk K+ transport system NAD-binding subunit
MRVIICGAGQVGYGIAEISVQLDFVDLRRVNT